MLNAIDKNLVLVPTEAPTQSKGGIIFAEDARTKPCTGKVASKGENVSCKIAVGDTVLYTKYHGIEFEGFLVVNEKDVLATVEA